MIEKDLMEQVGIYLDESVVTVNRQTTAGNTVYKVAVYSREKVETILRTLLPHLVGTKTRTKVEQLLEICDQYNEWVAAGGRSNVARLANQASQQARKIL
jgi:K+ transporter